MARPKKTKGESRDRLLQVRVQAREYKYFKEAAQIAGLDLSAWVRERLLQATRKELREYVTPKEWAERGRVP
jgi:uncharacterized protein (DUF1778 family)